jgi:hypothetical protein
LIDDDFPKDITVLQTMSEIQDKDFKRVDIPQGIYNHHNVFIELSKRPAVAYTCESVQPKGVPVAVFMAGATETGDIRFAATKGDIKTGYYLSKDRVMLNMIDVVNYNKEERDIYTSSEIEFVRSAYIVVLIR